MDVKAISSMSPVLSQGKFPLAYLLPFAYIKMEQLLNKINSFFWMQIERYNKTAIELTKTENSIQSEPPPYLSLLFPEKALHLSLRFLVFASLSFISIKRSVSSSNDERYAYAAAGEQFAYAAVYSLLQPVVSKVAELASRLISKKHQESFRKWVDLLYSANCLLFFVNGILTKVDLDRLLLAGSIGIKAIRTNQEVKLNQVDAERAKILSDERGSDIKMKAYKEQFNYLFFKLREGVARMISYNS